MNHPEPADWIPHLFGETAGEQGARLEAHLRDCAECRAQFEAWRVTLRRLDRWQLPVAGNSAAVAGSAHARSAPSVFPASPGFAFLRWAAVVLVAALVGGVAGRWSAPSASPVPTVTASERGPAAGSVEVLAALEQLRQENDARYLALRRDLETLATSTDAAIRQAHRGLLQLAVHQSPEKP